MQREIKNERMKDEKREQRGMRMLHVGSASATCGNGGCYVWEWGMLHVAFDNLTLLIGKLGISNRQIRYF